MSNPFCYLYAYTQLLYMLCATHFSGSWIEDEPDNVGCWTSESSIVVRLDILITTGGARKYDTSFYLHRPASSKLLGWRPSIDPVRKPGVAVVDSLHLPKVSDWTLNKKRHAHSPPKNEALKSTLDPRWSNIFVLIASSVTQKTLVMGDADLDVLGLVDGLLLHHLRFRAKVSK